MKKLGQEPAFPGEWAYDGMSKRHWTRVMILSGILSNPDPGVFELDEDNLCDVVDLAKRYADELLRDEDE